MTRLFTYTIPVDDGAAPNPFHGMCSLAICKPKIRRVAQPGDWVAGLGSKNTQGGRDLSGKLVYTMRVEEVMTLAEYDRRAPQEWPHRIPNIQSLDLADRLGDCIYDYGARADKEPKQRPGVHASENIKADLGGINALVSRHFYYFGSRAIELPPRLKEICHQSQGHKSNANNRYVEEFVNWLEGQGRRSGQLYGWPDFIIDWSSERIACGCEPRAREQLDDTVC